MKNEHKPKPDDRRDNVDKLQHMVHDTIENIEESHETLRYSSSKAREQIQAKNEHRREARKSMREEIKSNEYSKARKKNQKKKERRREEIEGMREEIKDEYNHQQQKEE